MPVGEKSAHEGGDGGGSPSRRSGQKSGLTDRDVDKDEHWTDRDEKFKSKDHGEDETQRSTVAARFEDKEITDLKMVRCEK